MQIGRSFKFDAAHKIPNHPGKCRFLHGHTWKMDVIIEGKINPETGMVIDFNLFNKVVNNILDNGYDHAYLNDKIENPTCEITSGILAQEILDALRCECDNNTITKVKVILQEGEGGYATGIIVRRIDPNAGK